MKNLTLILAFLLPAVLVSGQQKIEVIASAGGYSVASGISISWTLGETIIPNFTSPDGTISLAHGFQQKLVITKVEELIEDPVIVTVYPNPASEFVRVEFEQPTDTEIRMSLLDFRGKLVKADRIGAGTIIYEIEMQTLSSGIYYIRLQKGRFVNVYRVVKL